MEKKLTKSNNKMLSGVLAGIAEYLGFDPTVVRIAYLFLTLFTAFAGVIAYLLMMLVMPEKQSAKVSALIHGAPITSNGKV